ncbi:MAG: glycosyl transferase group 1 [Herbinix sp.]|jgi:glycosyltransferase involved in cell wall biosynthesis|nr:glycosyl transferase group 1 [Herbinix sp.]
MKKMLIMTSGMYGGGVEKALLNMLHFIPRNEYTITLLLLKMEGEFLPLLPKDIILKEINVKQLSSNEFMRNKSMKRLVYDYVKAGKFLKAMNSICRKYFYKDYFYYIPNKIEALENMDKDLEEEYDLAICYHIHCPFNLAYIAKKVKAHKKIAWIHNDFKTTKFPVKQLFRYFDCYAEFYVVSDQLKSEFMEVMPLKYHNQVTVFKNILLPDAISRMSYEFIPQEYQSISKITYKLLSIGRLTSQKGFDVAIQVCSKLKEQGKDFIWYIIGEGEDRKKLEDEINEFNVGDRIKLLGLRMNPYPYIKNCDIYVQPSRHEGYGIAVAEARVLHKPIICTDFVGAFEQITNGINGFIVHFSVEELTNAILNLMQDEELRNRLEDNLKRELTYNQLIADDNVKTLLNSI